VTSPTVPRRAKAGGGGRLIGGGFVAPERLDPRAVWRRLGEVVAAPDEHERALLGGLPAERLREGGLADPRLPADQDQAAAPGEGVGETLPQDREFSFPPREGRRMQRQHCHWYST
jgi:hypothetical protein